MRKQAMVGTIVGVFDRTLDGLCAQLIRRRALGYTVELLEATDGFPKGTILELSVAEFHITSTPLPQASGERVPAAR